MRFWRVIVVCLVVGWSAGWSAERRPEAESGEESLGLLQRKLEQREKRALAGAITTNLTGGKKLAPADAEQLYLSGRITARQFHALLEHVEPARATTAPVGPVLATNQVHQKAIEVLRRSQPRAQDNPQPGPVLQREQVVMMNPGQTEEGEDLVEKGFSEIEAKMDALLQLRTARQSGGDTNVNVQELLKPTTARTKRQRLDELLRLYIRGKLPEKEYNEYRSRIIAEPDPKP